MDEILHRFLVLTVIGLGSLLTDALRAGQLRLCLACGRILLRRGLEQPFLEFRLIVDLRAEGAPALSELIQANSANRLLLRCGFVVLLLALDWGFLGSGECFHLCLGFPGGAALQINGL